MSHIDGRLWLGNRRHHYPRLIRGRGNGGGIAISDHNEDDEHYDEKDNEAGKGRVNLICHLCCQWG